MESVSLVLPFSCSNSNKSLDNFLQKYARKNDVVILASRDSYYFSDEMPISIEHKKDFANGFTKYYDKEDKMISRKTMARLAFNDVKSLSEMLSLKKVKSWSYKVMKIKILYFIVTIYSLL